MKFVLWTLIVVAIVLWLLYNKKQSVGADSSTAAKPTGERQDKDVEPMLQCAHCGLHIPASESIVTPSGAVFCSEAHRLEHAGS
ncbi:MAG: PP0621 family protein [Noviherbaspirillum sp.]